MASGGHGKPHPYGGKHQSVVVKDRYCARALREIKKQAERVVLCSVAHRRHRETLGTWDIRDVRGPHRLIEVFADHQVVGVMAYGWKEAQS